MKVLNLYACLGGNRLKWDEVTNCEVTAVELDPVAAKLYQERFPNDKVVVADAHEFLVNHFREYDFIWSSPPCPTHSRLNVLGKNWNIPPRYPDLMLYEEIIFLEHYFEGKYCVENVIPYYKPLISAHKRGRHLYWTNFKLPNILSKRSVSIRNGSLNELSEFHNYDFRKYREAGGKQRVEKMARNLVDYEAGKIIFEHATQCIKAKQVDQLTLL